MNRSKHSFAIALVALLSMGTLPLSVRAQQQPAASVAGEDSERRVEAILSQMTLEEKIDLLGGVNAFDVRGVPRLGVPLMHTADSPFGVRALREGRSNLMAGGVALAATWDAQLAERVGTEIGRDARSRGVSFSLGPGVNIYRAPLNGRNFEYFGEDPFLAARMTVGFVDGMQRQGVSAVVKHFLGNNSEFARNTSDSVIDERALREIYLPAFEAAVKEANVGSVMDSYNLTNGAYMTQNGRFNSELLKKEWGFRGVVMSDWGATHDTLGAANGGLDLEMPSGLFLNREKLLPLVKSGQVSEATIDDKVRRILRLAVRFGWLDRPQLDPSVPRLNPRGRDVALETAREGMVLLKNDGNLLPLDRSKVKTVALIGPNAYPAVPLGGGSATIVPFHAVSFLEGLSNLLGAGVDVQYSRGIQSVNAMARATNFLTAPTGGQAGLSVESFDNLDLSGAPSAARTDQHVVLGTPFDVFSLFTGEVDLDLAALGAPKPTSVRWTGYYTPQSAGAHDLFVQQGGFGTSGYRLYVDDKLVADSWTTAKAVVEQTSLALDASPHKIVVEYHGEGAFGGPLLRMGIVPEGGWVDQKTEEMAAKADAVILAVGFDPTTETEAWDRTFRLPPGQDELIRRIAAVNRNTVVVVTSGGAVDMNGWVDKVPGVLEAWYPGQEGGTALAEILFGDVNPSGHLPATFERRWEDNPVHDSYYTEDGSNRIPYKEGVFVGYRGYEKNGVKPLFPFGYGLSYTTFSFSGLTSKPLGDGPRGPRYEVSFDVKNTGSREGSTVAQVYVGGRHDKVERPAKELKGFAKVALRPGETKRVSVVLDGRSFAYYDTAARAWQVDAGDFDVLVGSSSVDLPIRGTISLPKAVTIGVDR